MRQKKRKESEQVRCQWESPAVEPRTLLAWAASALPRSYSNQTTTMQPSQSPLCTAQMVLNASVACTPGSHSVCASELRSGPPRGLGGAQGKYAKWGPTKWIVWAGSGGTPPGNFEILHALKCVLGAPEALFRACTQYTVHIYRSCKLPFSISGFRSKSTTYGALASGQRSRLFASAA